MKNIFFTPGPSGLYFTAEQHIKNALNENIPSISHRSKSYVKMHQETTEALTELLQLPDNFTIGFTSSATEIWDRMSENLIANRSLHFVNGDFSKKFHSAVAAHGKNAESREVEAGTHHDLSSVVMDEDIELIGLAQNETSTGAAMPVEDINLLRSKYPTPLLAIDAVSSLPVPAFDFNQLDSLYFSVQKSFGLPAGLGVWTFNDRCLEKAEAMKANNQYHESYNSLLKIAKMAQKHQTTCTPNVLNIYLLGKVVQDMNTKGIGQIRQEAAYKSALLYNLFESHPKLSAFVADKKFRSQTVGVANVEGGSEKLIAGLAAKGLHIGNGYGEFKNKQIRIASFPTHSKEQIEMLVDEINQLDF
ncbi:aminotransferase class V-fold PLP-dependent enzyme [Reichenbachiella carrageenanivorans]|uniref:phosphoserine transaminase n=1 Tax=Reichenbachiella carrageenanivorans TaxID=2979869 RepID=A0ABY6CXA1_9BACT|nr:aminotransferase class V-fold PLP-dependent enzyme [Reichenbachiella carrageenanivorans]UXX78547.1 aminotransferase class V-fold PLP-dependent enzyme [Reichenbachiella carrageenanivorans]